LIVHKCLILRPYWPYERVLHYTGIKSTLADVGTSLVKYALQETNVCRFGHILSQYLVFYLYSLMQVSNLYTF